MSSAEHFKRASAKMRESLARSPRALAAVVIAAGIAPASVAGDYEYMARTIGSAIGSGSNGSVFSSNPTSRAVTVVTETLMGRFGRSMDEADNAKRRQEEEDARIAEQARRDAIYEVHRRRELERQGVPYEQINARGASSAAGSYDRYGPPVTSSPSVRLYGRY